MDEFTRHDWELDGYLSGREVEFEQTHPLCPTCNTPMFPEIEFYELFENKYYICPRCGYCMDKGV